jgi:acrylyl-CoA reductase (NADPH)
MSVRALVLTQGADRKVSGAIETLDDGRLPAGDVTVAVEYSTLNYKDGLVLTSGGGLVKTWPHVGGIDLAGTSRRRTIRVQGGRQGRAQRLAGRRAALGRLRHKARLKGDWLVKLPASISTKRAMAIGTAGYTSMLCVTGAAEAWRAAGVGEVLVTGAAGGVGSVAVAILARLGYQVVAATGRPQEGEYLKGWVPRPSSSARSSPRRPTGRSCPSAMPAWSTPSRA